MVATPTTRTVRGSRETPPIEPLLSVADVAEILQVSKATVYALVKDGRLRPVDIGVRKTRFRRTDVERFIGEEGADTDGT
jgi:excisionase family DNA binding protein